MAFNVNGLADYIKGDPQVILTDIIFAGRSFGLLRVEDDIKSSKKVVDLTDNEIVLQTGDYTGYDGFSGDDTLKDVLVEVEELHVKKQYKKNDINTKVTQLALKQGSDPSDIGYKDLLMEMNGKELNYQNEQLLWRGDTSITGTSNLNKFNGFVKQITDSSSATTTGVAASGYTSATAIAGVNRLVDKMEETFPEWIGMETHLFLSPRDFQTYYRALYGLNASIDKDNIEGKPVESVRVPGTNVIAQSMPGLNGTVEKFITRPMNLIIGTDLVSETDELDFMYNDIARWHELFALYKLGAKVVRPQEVVIEAE